MKCKDIFRGHEFNLIKKKGTHSNEHYDGIDETNDDPRFLIENHESKMKQIGQNSKCKMDLDFH